MNACLLRGFIATGVLLLLSMPLLAAASAPRVKTQLGIVEGKVDGAVAAFLGIPYAEPPVGELRWKPPVPATKWSGVRKAIDFGPHCLQGPVYGDMKFRDPGGSEDCLTLNVWAPAKPPSAKLPVMVWIHGGGFVAGATSESRQDGTHLAQHDVIVVSMNYRLGVFGFLVHPELAKESGRNSSGNYGLLDQLAALRWVEDNIGAFGGDPNNVTIFGESAGSFSVSAQMASPLSRGLFQRAIGESGAAFSFSGLSFDPLAVREQGDVKLVSEKLGVSTLAELRAVGAEKLLEVFGKPPEAFAFGPDVDGYFLPESVPAIFASGKQNDVPLLAGWNHDEGSFQIVFSPQKPTVENVKATAEKDFGDKAPEFLKLYPAGTDLEALRSAEDYAGDRFIAASTWAWMDAQSKTGKQPIYRFRFDLGPPPTNPSAPQLGAFHSAEIEYVFGQLDSKAGVPWRSEDRQLSELIGKYWTNFAKAGDPNGPGLPPWPKYSAAESWPVMLLGAPSAAHADDLRDRYLFLEANWPKQ